MLPRGHNGKQKLRSSVQCFCYDYQMMMRAGSSGCGVLKSLVTAEDLSSQVPLAEFLYCAL